MCQPGGRRTRSPWRTRDEVSALQMLAVAVEPAHRQQRAPWEASADTTGKSLGGCSTAAELSTTALSPQEKDRGARGNARTRTRRKGAQGAVVCDLSAERSNR